MYENNQFNVNIYAEQLQLYKRLAKKYGLAMIILTLNTFITPYFFMIPTMLISEIFGFDLFAEGSDAYYYTVMALNELSAYVVPILLIYNLFKEERRAFIPDKTYSPFFGEAIIMFMMGMTAGAGGTLLTEAINSVIDHFFGTGEIEDVFTGMEPSNMGQFGVFAFCICVIAPITEEFIFRDLLLKPLRAYGDMTAAAVTGLLFGLYHGNFDQFAYAAILGFFYSVIAVKHNSIVPTVLLHAANNILVTLSGYLPSVAEGLADEGAKELCTNIADICSSAVVYIMIGGIIGMFILLGGKCFKLHNHNLYVPEPDSAKDFFSVPWVIAGLAVMVVAFFV